MKPAGLILISFARYGENRKRDDFVVDALFYFEPVQRFEYRVICSVVGF